MDEALNNSFPVASMNTTMSTILFSPYKDGTLHRSNWACLAGLGVVLCLVGCVTTGPGLTANDQFLRDNTLFGKPMASLPLTTPDSLSGLSQQQCPKNRPQCTRFFADHAALSPHKALAIPVVEDGVGVSSGQAGPQQAFLLAIYNCNHIPGVATRLCEVQTVDGKDIRTWTATALSAHRQAFAALKLPGRRFFGSEELGSSWVTANALRTGASPSGETPPQIDGVTTYYTQDLVRALMGPSPPLVIDVGSNYDVIPMARSLYRGGLAFDDAAFDKDYETRFAGLLKQLSPDINKPVVFYCQGSNCWFSVNAALRARRLGYTQVGWYRGGIHSWKAAGLPVATAVVKAVVQQ
jgi:rhodanese-related sulfurtransferase